MATAAGRIVFETSGNASAAGAATGSFSAARSRSSAASRVMAGVPFGWYS